MTINARLFGYEVPGWPIGTRHYFGDDGKVLAVTIDQNAEDSKVMAVVNETLGFAGEPAHTIVPQPTHIIECRPDGLTDSLDPVHVSTPGASHEEALLEFGYTVTQ